MIRIRRTSSVSKGINSFFVLVGVDNGFHQVFDSRQLFLKQSLFDAYTLHEQMTNFLMKEIHQFPGSDIRDSRLGDDDPSGFVGQFSSFDQWDDQPPGTGPELQ